MNDTETPEVPKEATLSLDSSIAEPPPSLAPTEPVNRKQIRLTPDALMNMLRGMIESGNMTPAQAAELRRKLGVSQAFFTGKKVTREEKNKKKNIADASRRKNRYNGSSKGMKRDQSRGS